MDREILNGVEFKSIKLPKNKAKEPGPVNDRAPAIKSKLAKVVFYLFIVLSSLFAGKLAIEYTWTFLSGSTTHIPISEILYDIQNVSRGY